MYDVLHISGVLVLAFLFLYWVWDNGLISTECRCCHVVVAPGFCTLCEGKGKWEIRRGEFVTCTHRRFIFVNKLICRLCRPNL